eukprot:521613-Amorphochlora_amoeboformis.AAC.1
MASWGRKDTRCHLGLNLAPRPGFLEILGYHRVGNPAKSPSFGIQIGFRWKIKPRLIGTRPPGAGERCNAHLWTTQEARIA